MANTDKIFIGEFEFATKELEYKYFEWNGIQVEVKPRLSFKEMLSLVHNVVEVCIPSETNEYMPEVKDFALNRLTVEAYTNLELPEDVEQCYKILHETNILSMIRDRIYIPQYHEIERAIDSKIEYILSTNIARVQKMIDELFSSMEQLVEKQSKLFEEVSNDDIKSLMEAITEGEIDTDKLVRSFISNGSKNEE